MTRGRTKGLSADAGSYSEHELDYVIYERFRDAHAHVKTERALLQVRQAARPSKPQAQPLAQAGALQMLSF